jgi:hypothetical protein
LELYTSRASEVRICIFHERSLTHSDGRWSGRYSETGRVRPFRLNAQKNALTVITQIVGILATSISKQNSGSPAQVPARHQFLWYITVRGSCRFSNSTFSRLPGVVFISRAHSIHSIVTHPSTGHFGI